MLSLATASYLFAGEGKNNATEVTLDEVSVIGKIEAPDKAYVQSMDSKQIERTPNTNGDIGSLLRGMSNIQFDNTQNNFLIDGVNFNNDLDPAYENFATNPNQLANKASGRAKALRLILIC